ncbi:MAG: glycoside hydrolase family 25 protein [Agathobacter sp.]|nr:glycoside hydrolase family 25 protein [Agathobacter sp.]
MKKNVIIQVIAVILLTTLLLGACGNNKSENTQGAGNSTDLAKEQKEMLHFVDARGNSYDIEIQPDWPKHEYEKNAFIKDGHKMIYENNTKYTYSLGVDVSKYQQDIDWKKVKAAGYDFAFVRIGYRGYGESGKLCQDERAIAHIKGARAAGLNVGLYFFSQAVNEKEAREEADFTLQILKDNGIGKEDITLPIVFDPESILDDEARTDNVTGEQFTRNTLEFAKVIKAAGYQPMIYCNLLWEAQMLDLGQLSELPLWYADYLDTPQTPYAFEYWQYSESAKVDGIPGEVDVNIRLKPKK